MSARTFASRLLGSGSHRRSVHASSSRLNVTHVASEAHVAPTPPLSAATSEAASSSNTASSSNFAPKAEDTRSRTSNAKVVSSLILSRLPIVLREPSAFENAYYKYNQQLSEALQQPFARDFYFKKGSAIEKRFNEEQGKLSLGFSGIGKPAKGAAAKEVDPTPSQTNTSGVAEGVVESQPLPRITEADQKNDVTSLDRKLDRTLYLVVKQKGVPAWSFPSTSLEGTRDSLHRSALKKVSKSLGDEMDIWMVSHLPIGLHKPAEDEKVFFLSAHILAGNPQLVTDKGDIDDYCWLTREEIQKLLLDANKPDYWQSVDDLLDL